MVRRFSSEGEYNRAFIEWIQRGLQANVRKIFEKFTKKKFFAKKKFCESLKFLWFSTLKKKLKIQRMRGTQRRFII